MDNTEKALQILKAAEIKESDFKSESIYNTIVGNIIMLLLEQDKMKEALFHRNQIIQDLDQEIQELDKDIEELNDKIESLEHDVHLTECELKAIKLKYNECVKNSVM
jgi:predicted  nucleic acid-binding Zn-ribbon protein